jgi:hypothetical protein
MMRARPFFVALVAFLFAVPAGMSYAGNDCCQSARAYFFKLACAVTAGDIEIPADSEAKTGEYDEGRIEFPLVFHESPIVRAPPERS